jgi:hypothetical protein
MSKINQFGWSEQDKRIHKLTGFTPVEKSLRQCTSCNEKGHYYYECNNGQFFKDADALISGLQDMLSDTELKIK